MYNLKIILRNLRRSPVYSTINIVGLSIGITASVLIFLWVYNEYSFDNYHREVDRIYRITGQSDGEPSSFFSYPFVLVAQDVPEVENVAVMKAYEIEGIKIDNEVFSGNDAVYVNGEWFDVFDYKLIDGSITSFKSNPYSVVLTKSEAKKFFGDHRAIGQNVQINSKNFIVQAVVDDNPANSSFQQKVFASVDAYLATPYGQNESKQWGWWNWIIFVKLSSRSDIQQICAKMNALIPKEGWKNEVSLKSLSDIHFETDVKNTVVVHGNKKTVSIFILLGLLLLFTACINYVNLTTAKANLRAKEIGIKKIIGAKRKSLFMQFIIESFVVSLFSIFISLFLLWILSPLYHLLIEYGTFSFSSTVLWIILSAVLLVTTLLNGIYPALMLSSFKPISILKGMSLPNMKDGSLRKCLVVFQFTLSTVLIISVLTIYNQMQYVRNMNPGYNREQIFSIQIPFQSLFVSGNDKEAKTTMETIKHELQRNPNIVGVSLSNGGDITNVGSSIGVEGNCDWDGKTSEYAMSANFMSADGNYQQLTGLKMVEGRWFEEEKKEDENNVILNETAFRELKLSEPFIGKRFKCMGREGQIIGVVKDFHFRSLHDKIAPLIIINSQNYKINIKTQSGKTIQSVEAAKKIWSEFFPNAPFEYSFLDDSFNNLYKSDIRTSQLMLAFCILTVLIALLGLFGLSTFAIERRSKEIGIRKIMGASVPNIIQLVTKEFLILVTIAFIIAAPISWWAMNQWLNNFAYRISINLWIFIAGGILTLIIALIAMGWQAVKAAMANPVNSIKTE